MNRETEVMPRVRRARLLELIDREAHGNAAEYARKYGIGQSLLSRYVSGTGKFSKPMGWTAARNMEKTIGLPENYLDDEAALKASMSGGKPARHQPVHQEPAEPPAPAPTPARRAAAPTAPADLVAMLSELAGAIPADRCAIVSGLISAVLTSNPPNPVFAMLLREELAKHGLA